MFSLSQLRRNLFPIFNLMIKTGAPIHIVYGERENRKAYQLILIPSDLKPHLIQHTKRKRISKIQSLPTEICQDCDSIKVAGICMNKDCVSNK